MFDDEFVLGEAFDVEEEVGGQGVEQPVSFPGVEVLLGFQAVVFRQDGGQWHLRYDVLLQFVLEERRRGQVEGQHQVACGIHQHFCSLFEAQTVTGIRFGGDLLGFNLQLSLENPLYDARSRFRFAAP